LLLVEVAVVEVTALLVVVELVVWFMQLANPSLLETTV
jgi:hypothetical protein